MKPYIRNLVIKILTPLAKQLVAKHSPQVVAVTGSAGKTSTKRAIAAAVETTYKTQWHEDNYNSDIGLPLAIFEITSPPNTSNPFAWLSVIFRAVSKRIFWNYPYELLILEFGIDHKGEMDGYLNIVTPDIGIITAIHGAHLEGFKSLETVYKEKTKLALHAKKALVNADDELLRTRFLKKHPQTLTYGFSPKSNYHIEDINRRKNGELSCSIEGQDVDSKFIATHQLLSLAAGWGVADLLGIAPGAAAQNLSELEPHPGRMNILRGKKGSTLIDDSYNNASVAAAKASIKTLVDYPAKKRRILVFGTMNEMGAKTESSHREVAQFAAKHNIDYIATVGKAAQNHFADELMVHGFDKEKIQSFLSPYQAGHHLADYLKNGDVVLIKGSQNGVFAEEVTALLLNLDSDRSKLVRQSARWQRIKQRQFHNETINR